MTAVEFIFQELENRENGFPHFTTQQIYNKAKEMEKQQIIDTYIECKRQYVIQESCFPPQFVVKEAEQYYNETFNK